MEHEVCFCTDGVLRLKYGNKPMVPLSFIHKTYEGKRSDLSFWATWWDGRTIFEDGLTVGQFLSCLKPWTEFWSDLTHKDIGSFIEESKKPLLVKEDGKNKVGEYNRGDDLTWISLAYTLTVDMDIEYKRDVGAIKGDFNKWLNQKRSAKLTGDWDINGFYKLTGYKENIIEHYSVDHSPMNELANIPLVLNEKQIVYFQDFNAKRILGENAKIFDDNAYGVRKFKIPDSNYEFVYVQGEKFHKLRDVIEGFFWWMPRNPIVREEFNESLRATMKAHKLEKEEILNSKSNVINISEKKDKELPINKKLELEKNVVKSKEDNVVSIGKGKKSSLEEKSNIINLFENDSEVDDDGIVIIEEINDDTEKGSKLKVEVAPGAFDSIIETVQRQSNFMDDMIERASKEKDVVLKIGQIKESIEPEKRVHAHIVEEVDISTPYKKI